MRNRTFIIGGLMAILTAVPVRGTLAQGPAPLPPTAPRAGRRLQRERHPELQRALRALQHARSELQHAARDFSGHREKAADLTQQAIQQVRAAMQSDRQ